jgi:hypothetical protein
MKKIPFKGINEAVSSVHRSKREEENVGTLNTST